MQTIFKHFNTIDSTNNWAKANGSLLTKESLLLVTADTQTAGRGRFNRKWVSPMAQNIYATFAFLVDKDQKECGNIPQILSVSAAKVLEKLKFHPKIKWPNDLLLENKKVAGILAETTMIGEDLCFVVGIGLNINMPQELLKDIDRPATSLLAESSRSFSVKEVTRALHRQFLNDLELFLKGGFAAFLGQYRSRMICDPLCPIKFHDNLRVWEGTVQKINEDGSLCLKLATGELKTFIAGEILY